MQTVKKYFLHILLILFVWVGAGWGIYSYLGDYTLHGETITVPDLRGFQLSEVDSVISGKGLRYKVIDSVYSSEVPRGAVVKQDPKELGQVKQNRNVYITINSRLPQRVKVPDLIDLSLRQAISIAESFGLEIDSVYVVPDECKRCVLAQLYAGKSIKPGALIEKGKKIDLKIGGGESRDKVGIPDLTDLNLRDAKRILDPLNVSLIAVYDGKTVENRIDSLRAIIYKQDPVYEIGAEMNRGSSIDLYLKVE
ncbi:MAG: PASTA domain-containing protein [Flavobacteriales bacterium]|nr:PASTA domain-containing protein [Flavobacteriales bacterium]